MPKTTDNMTTPLLIIRIVFDYFGIDTSLCTSKTRKHKKVQACQFAMYFIRAYTRLSLAETGALFNKDHATTIYACKKLNFEISKYRDARQDFLNLEGAVKLKVNFLNYMIQQALEEVNESKYANYDTDKC